MLSRICNGRDWAEGARKEEAMRLVGRKLQVGDVCILCTAGVSFVFATRQRVSVHRQREVSSSLHAFFVLRNNTLEGCFAAYVRGGIKRHTYQSKSPSLIDE